MSGRARRIDMWPAVAGTVAAAAWLLLAAYPPVALAAVVALYFVIYAGARLRYWRVQAGPRPDWRRGLNWALIGFDPATQVFDARPVRVYFLMLTLLALGLLLRPFARLLVD